MTRFGNKTWWRWSLNKRKKCEDIRTEDEENFGRDLDFFW